MDDLGKLHSVSLQQWISEGVVFKFVGDNVDKQRRVRDYRSEHQGELLHMYSLLVARSRTPAPELIHSGQLSKVMEIPNEAFLPSSSDIHAVKSNIVILISRIIVQYFPALGFLSKTVPKHIHHKYSQKMSEKSEVVVMDVLMKNETIRKDMLEIMGHMQDYLGENYSHEHRIASGGDHLTCERQKGSQKHVMDGNTHKDRLDVFEPMAEDFHFLMCIVVVCISKIIYQIKTYYFPIICMYSLQMMWKVLYGKSASDHGTLAFFRSYLRRIPVTADPKKDINACVDLIYTVMKGHILAAACEVLKVTQLEDSPVLPSGLQSADKQSQLTYICDIAQAVAEKCTLVETAFSENPRDSQGSIDSVYNYARVLCHFGSLVMEVKDAWSEGDGERMIRCWKLLVPHFKTLGHPKYALEAMRLQMQVNATLSPNLAHQVTWNRFVNTRGGHGRNIPCDLHNEHVNKMLKHIISTMGSNLTEKSLQRAARCVTALQIISERFDAYSGVPYHTSAHSTMADRGDVKKVMEVV